MRALPALRKATSGYGRFTMDERKALKWEFLEVDLDRCALSHEDGAQREWCTTNLLHGRPEYRPKVTVVDEQVYLVGWTKGKGCWCCAGLILRPSH